MIDGDDLLSNSDDEAGMEHEKEVSCNLLPSSSSH